MSSQNDRDLAFPQKVENPFGELKEGAVGCNDVQSVAAANPNATVINKAPAEWAGSGNMLKLIGR